MHLFIYVENRSFQVKQKTFEIIINIKTTLESIHIINKFFNIEKITLLIDRNFYGNNFLINFYKNSDTNIHYP